MTNSTTDDKFKEREPSAVETWISRTTAILAVIAAISSGRWGACNLQAILEQGKVNDTWSYYQAKSMKQHEAEQTRDLATALSASAQDKQAFEQLKEKMADEAKREEQEKNQQQEAALNYQKSRDHYVESSFWFEISFAALQLGVILCTIASAARHKTAWLIGLVLGVFGLMLLVNGFYRIVPAPKSWYQGSSDQMAAEIKSKPVTTSAP
jgi:hypothetical protein